MKILQIKIENLASLEGQSLIDFTSEPLLSAGIFAITGPTGAGKSTILDALCIALYGKAPRYAQAKSKGVHLQDSSGELVTQSDPRSILRDGATTGSAAVCFEGLDGDHYEATWSVKRARQRVTGKLSDTTHVLYNHTKKQEVPGTKTVIQKEIERLVGLNFDQFTRSVLLAQGEFTAFMKADKEEKSTLLEKLTGSQIYSSISQKIYEHTKTEEQRLKELQLKASNIELLTEDQITAASQQIKQLQQQAKELKAQKETTQQTLNWYQKTAELTTKRHEAEEQLQQARQAIADLSETKALLTLVQAVQPLRSIQSSLEEERAQYQSDQVQEQSLSVKKTQLAEKRQTANEELQAAESSRKQRQSELENARPLLATATVLDTQIQERDRQLRAQQEEVQKDRQQLDQYQQAQRDLRQTLNSAKQQYTSTQQWIQQHEDRSKIALHTPLILRLLGDAAEQLSRQQNEHQQILALQQTQEETSRKARRLDQDIQETANLQNSQQTALSQLEKMLQQASSQDPDQQMTVLQERQRTLEKSQDLFDTLTKAQNDYQLLSEEKNDIQQKTEAIERQLRELTPQLPQLQNTVATTRELIGKAELRHAENIERLRDALKPGSPCPVCGALEHPYGSGDHTDLAEDLLSQLREELRSAQAALDSANRSHTALTSENLLRKEQIEQLTQQLTAAREHHQSSQQQWLQSAVYKDLHDQNSSQVHTWFQQQLSEVQRSVTTLSDQKQALLKLQQQRNDLQSEVNQTTQTLQTLKDQKNALQNSINLTNQQITQHEAIQQQAQGKLTQLQAGLQEYFPSTDWFTNWQQNPGAFTAAIEKFAQQWRDKQNDQETLSRQIEQNTTSLEGYDRQLATIQTHFDQLLEALNQNRQVLDKHLSERRNIFEGKPVHEIEQALQQATEKSSQQKEKALKTVSDLEQEWISLQGALDTIANSLKQSASRQGRLEEKIRQQLAQYNKTHPPKDGAPELDTQRLAELLSYSEEWIAEHQNKINTATEAEVAAVSSLKAREQDLKNQMETQPPAETQTTSPEALQLLLDQQGKALEEVSEKLLEQELLLKNNEKNIQKQGGLLQQITEQEKIYNDWNALNSLIGSKDGKRFREIAQQYTLDILLGYANRHLTGLSKRYLLSRIPGSLAIQVIDHDMADEVRSVYSLSGGESFLVSLALALGLASLSSHRLKVESLFIDEGFGSLDPNTLSVAMDALERLQDQGRKVGVISHVQEMTERIAVQIQVHKKQSGKSQITVESLV